MKISVLLTSIKHDTMTLAGTSNLQDAWDDLKIPFHLTRYTKQYQDTDNLLKNDPQVTKIVGHSLSGSVCLELQKQHPTRDFDISKSLQKFGEWVNDRKSLQKFGE